MREIFIEVASSLRNNKLRTALTGFAVSWGIFLLIALLGAGNGLMHSFMGNMEDFVSRTVSVEGWYTSKPHNGFKEGRIIQLGKEDLNYTQSNRWQGVIDNVSTRTSSSSSVLSLNGKTVNGWLSGAMPEHQDQFKIKMAVGRFLDRDDLRERRKVVVVSGSQAKELIPGDWTTLVGQWIKVGALSYQVVGIYHTDERDFRRSCYIPYSTYKGIYDRTENIETISFSVNGPETLEEHRAFEADYTGDLKRMHDIAPDDNMGLWVRNGYTDNLEMAKASSILRIALWILGLLTLVSGIVGVSNIMLITVKERTHEFGVRKAIGAKPGDILKLIIAESIFITALFGYVGMLLGMVACQVMDKTVGQQAVDLGFEKIQMLVNPTVGLDIAMEATLLLIIAGTLAGIIPAWKAARVKPIEALRAE